MLIVRDPRDVAVSWSRWIFTPFNRLHRPTLHASPDALLRSDLPTRAQEWNDYLRSWLEEAPADPALHLIFYEQLVADTPHELGRIARHLGLDVAPQAFERVAVSHALGEMRKKQPHHVFRGHWGGWREHLDDRQALQAQQICGRMMKALGYPLTRSDCDTRPPAALHPPARPASSSATATSPQAAR